MSTGANRGRWGWGNGWFMLAARGAWFYRRTHVGILLGVCLSSAVLVGSLLMGDSVRISLEQSALQRLGSAEFAVATPGRFFAKDLAERMDSQLPAHMGTAVQLAGVVAREGAAGERRQLNRVQVVGADPGFWALSPVAVTPPGRGEVSISWKVAERLGVTPGDVITVSVAKPSLLSRQAPLAGRENRLMRRGLLTVREVLSSEQFGRFSLQSNQIAPYNVFVNPEWLRDKLKLGDRANVLLMGSIGDPLSIESTQDALAASWRLEDVGLSIVPVSGGADAEDPMHQLVSDGVFIPDAIGEQALTVMEPSAGTSAYLLQSISLEKNGVVRSTPYSFILAASPSTRRDMSPVPPDLADDEAVIHEWLAEALQAEEGDVLTVHVQRLGDSGAFVEETHQARVAKVVPTAELQAVRGFIPKFPGLSDVDRCRNWDVGMPMDETLLRDKRNEAYWEAYRDTPKMLVTLAAGQAMWGNSLGMMTSVRYGGANAEELERAIRGSLSPEQVGLTVLPVRELALAAVEQGMDFGELFVSMSAFLIAAALLLTGLLFVFAVDQRTTEMGMLMATGFRGRDVLRLLLSETGLIALLGCVVGVFVGSFYTRLLVWAVGAHWQAVTAGASIQFHATPIRLVIGGVSAFVCAFAALCGAARHYSKRSAQALLSGAPIPEVARCRGIRLRAFLRWGLFVGLTALAVAMVLHAVVTDSPHSTGVFFGAGSLLLVAGLAGCRLVLGRLQERDRDACLASGPLSLFGLGVRNASRQIRRSLAVCGLLAAALFLVLSVSAMRHDVGQHAGERWAATGGFELVCETTVPIPEGLSDAAAQQRFGFDRDARLAGVKIVSCKVRAGDDASCLNLNRAREPQLIGVDVRAMQSLGAFLPRGGGGSVWDILDAGRSDELVSALAGDGNTAMWGLAMPVGPVKGAEIAYADGVTVKLVGALPMSLSLFQGALLTALTDFNRHYPSIDGYSLFLVDVPHGQSVKDVQAALNERLARVGGDAERTVERVERFYAVENTYLSVFLVLGGLAVLLGAAGLGIVVMRHVLERRSELGMLACVGYSLREVRQVIIGEHMLLLVMGLIVGGVAATVSVWPSVAAVSADVPIVLLVWLLVGVLGIGALSIVLASHLALRGGLIAALRNE